MWAHESALKSSGGVDRRTFFTRFAQVVGVAAFGTKILCPGPTNASPIPVVKGDPQWWPLIAAIRRYVNHAYIEYDRVKARLAFDALREYGLTDEDLIPLQNLNRRLVPNGIFLTFFYMEAPTIIPVAKVFLVTKHDLFDGFMTDGGKCSNLYGEELDSYDRVLLGGEVYSSAHVPPIALAYDLASPDSQASAWVVAIPSGWIENLYGNRPGGIQERLIEELTIHEIAHITHRTRDELIPFLAQFGYRIGGRRIESTEDLVTYLYESRLTHHQSERFILERIYNADAYYGSSGSTGHLSALKEIKNGLIDLCEQVNRRNPSFPKHIIKISDQQCWGSMALLYYRIVHKKSIQEK